MLYTLSQPAPFNSNPIWISLDEMVSWVRVEQEDKEVLRGLLFAAMYLAEGECKQPLFEREYTVSLDGFISGVFPAFIIGDLSATYTQDGSADPVAIEAQDLILSGSTLRFSDSLSRLPLITGVTLTVKLGYTANNLPEDIKLALRMMVTDFWDNRGNGVRQLPTAAQLLLSPYKRYTC